jgi:hypothetical protein
MTRNADKRIAAALASHKQLDNPAFMPAAAACAEHCTDAIADCRE